MAYNKVPTSTTIKKKSAARRDKMKRKASAKSDQITNMDILALKRLQLEIDRYNKADIFKLDPAVRGIQPAGRWMIVRMFHEDLIKFIDESNPNNPQIDAYFRPVDARMRNTDKENYRPTPFPYLELGVVVAISPELRLALKGKADKYKKEFNEEMQIPQIGDVIEVRSNYSSVWYKEQRYYIDKQEQCRDFVRNPNELRLNFFKHYFKLEDFDYLALRKGEGRPVFFADEDEPQWYKDVTKELEAESARLDAKEADATEDLDKVEDLDDQDDFDQNGPDDQQEAENE